MPDADRPPRNEIAEGAARIFHEYLTETYPGGVWVRVHGIPPDHGTPVDEARERFEDGRWQPPETPE